MSPSVVITFPPWINTISALDECAYWFLGEFFRARSLAVHAGAERFPKARSMLEQADRTLADAGLPPKAKTEIVWREVYEAIAKAARLVARAETFAERGK